MKQTFSQFLNESLFDLTFSFDANVHDVQLHHEMWCDNGNHLDTSSLTAIEDLISTGDIPTGFVAFGAEITGPKESNNAMDFEPKAVVYLKHNHFEVDDAKKLCKFLKSKNLSVWVEPIFV